MHNHLFSMMRRKMHSSDKPEYLFFDVFDDCANHRRNPVKTSLRNLFPLIDTAAQIYDTKMSSCTSWEIDKISASSITPLSYKDFESLYDEKMVGGKTHARNIYDKILANSIQFGCCFCTYEDPTELDHFLPKTGFPEFSVLPLNLVPSCHRCNKAKDTHEPTSLSDSFIHPYFETLTEDILWLEAAADYSNEIPVIEFFITDKLSTAQKERFEFQFEKLDLGNRYSRQAAREISSRQVRWSELFAELGPPGLQLDLLKEQQSASSHNRNSWKSAFYDCVQKDEKFYCMDWSL